MNLSISFRFFVLIFFLGNQIFFSTKVYSSAESKECRPYVVRVAKWAYNVIKNREVISYSKNSFSKINSKLWNFKALTNQERLKAKRLSHNLSRLKTYQKRVYRNAFIETKVFRSYKEGQVIVFPGFTSTSKEWINAFGGDTMIIIHSKTGKDISWLSYFKEEKEVLFDKYSRFKILRKIELKRGETISFDPLIFKSVEDYNDYYWIFDNNASSSEEVPVSASVYARLLVLEDIN